MIVGYIRVSTERQADEGCSLAMQDEKVRSYCKLHDLSEPVVLQDDASGRDLERSGMRELLRLCAEGQVQAVVVYKLDRLTRSVRDLDYLLNTVFNGEGHIAFHSVTETYNTATAAGRLIMGIIGQVNQWLREEIAERTSDALRAKIARGERVGRAPLGFREQPGDLVVDEAEAEVVRHICKLRAQGLTIRALTNRLNEEGIPTKRGAKWHPATVHGVLSTLSAPVRLARPGG